MKQFILSVHLKYIMKRSRYPGSLVYYKPQPEHIPTYAFCSLFIFAFQTIRFPQRYAEKNECIQMCAVLVCLKLFLLNNLPWNCPPSCVTWLVHHLDSLNKKSESIVLDFLTAHGNKRLAPNAECGMRMLHCRDLRKESPAQL